jgi:predicted ATPase
MARFIKSLTLKKEFHNIQPFKIEFRDGLNVIVGENGAGKSSLLSLLTDTDHRYKDLISIDYEPGATFRFLDTEKHNPRIKSDCSNSPNIAFEVGSHFMSHGETILPLVLASKQFKKIALIVDEPESGISLKNQKKIFDNLQDISINNDCQVILTTHSYVIMKNTPIVFNMTTKQWITSEKYLTSLKVI